MSLLEVKNVKKIYTTRFGSNQVEALRDVNFTVERGEYVAIMGESGSGKTTLLNILAALDKPTEGKVYLKDRDLGKLKEKEIATFRRQNLGFVFQDFNLLDTFSLKDNIFLPLVLSGKKYPEMEKRLKPIAEKLGIEKLLEKYPYEVSGGQKQRAAIARALITKPQVLSVFFLPLVVAAIHVAVAFKVMTKILGVLNLTNVSLFAVCTIITIAVFAVFYIIVYSITAKEYYRIVN